MTELIRSPIPLYYQLQNIIREKIKQREYPANARIPSEHELCQEYQVSRQTVRHALKNLADEGLLKTLPGKGYFVGSQRQWFQSEWVIGSLDDLLALRKQAQMELLSSGVLEVKPNNHIARMLTLERQTNSVIYSKALWRVKKNKLAYTILYIPEKIPGRLGLEDQVKIYREGRINGLEGILNRVWEARQYIHAILAEREVSKALGIPKGEPIILLERLYLTKDGEPMMFGRVYYPSTFYTHILRLTRRG